MYKNINGLFYKKGRGWPSFIIAEDINSSYEIHFLLKQLFKGFIQRFPPILNFGDAG